MSDVWSTMSKKWTGIRDEEQGAARLSCAFFFLVLAGYYILKPMRDEMGLAGGVRNLPWLYLVNLLTMLVLAPVFGAAAGRWPRRLFVPGVFRLVMGSLLIFVALRAALPAAADLTLGRVFYVWVSVFNMWLVSMFWAVMADRWRLEQSKRLFGPIAIGGTVGAIVGAGLTTLLVEHVGTFALVLTSVMFFEGAARCAGALTRHVTGSDEVMPARKGPGFLEGITATLRSPYLLGIALFLMLYSLSSTFLYFTKAQMADRETIAGVERTLFFGRIELFTNGATLIMQLLLAGRLMPRVGVGPTLVVLPVLTGLGFLWLGLHPVLPVLITFEALRRAVNYALAKPAKETLFTIVPPDEKYKAKSFIDTFVYRGGDALGASVFKAATAKGASLAGVAFSAVPIAVLWSGVGLALGAAQRRRAAQQKETS